MRHFDREVVVTRWTPKDVKDAAVERVVAGEAVSLVARDVGVGPESVYGWLRVRGVEPPGRRASRLRDPFVREAVGLVRACLLYTSPSPRDKRQSRMPSSA